MLRAIVFLCIEKMTFLHSLLVPVVEGISHTFMKIAVFKQEESVPILPLHLTKILL